MTKRRLNTEQRRALKAAELQLFAKKYARKAQKGVEPNDRKHDPDVARALKHLAPAEVDALLRDGEDDG